MIAFVGMAFAGNDKNKDTNIASEAATTVSVSGNVADLITGESLTGVEISIEGTDIKAYSDFDGNFTFNNLNPGEYSIIASYISYKKSLIENLKVDGSQKVDIKLQED